MTKCVLSLTFSFALSAGGQTLPPLNDGEAHGDPRYLLEEGWIPLLNGKDLAGWHAQDGKPLQWLATRGVRWDQQDSQQRLYPAPYPGGVMLNSRAGKTSNIASDRKFGDVELYVEFLISRNSNSGVYLQGLYEVQIKDTYDAKEMGTHDCGAIYERWIEGKGVGGTAPFKNGARPAGQWQSFEIWFQAPRFDSGGRKTANARFLRVLHNGILIHENVEVDGPTRASMSLPEAPLNPLMIQGDHGPVALRNIYIRPLRPLKR